MSEDQVVDFRELLNKPMSDFPDMPDLPAGKTFYGKLVGMTADQSRNKGTPFFHFDIRLTDPGKDVDEASLKKLSDAGFSLADYTVGANFYLTQRAMTMFRRFVTSCGFSPNVSFTEALKLNQDTGEPTPETIDVIRGIDVMIKTPPMQENGRVYTQNVTSDGMITGVKRE
jgi:hypothetical protein